MDTKDHRGFEEDKFRKFVLDILKQGNYVAQNQGDYVAESLGAEYTQASGCSSHPVGPTQQGHVPQLPQLSLLLPLFLHLHYSVLCLSHLSMAFSFMVHWKLQCVTWYKFLPKHLYMLIFIASYWSGSRFLKYQK